VLAVIPAPTFGGSANQVLRLSAPLAERGWELVAVLPDEPGNAAERLEAAGLPVHKLPMRRLRNTLSPGPHLALARNAFPDVRRLRELVRTTGASVVQNHGDLNPQAGIAGHLEGAAVHWQLLDTRTPVPVRRVTMPLVTRLADSVSTVGEALARAYPGAQGLGARCVTVFPPVDHERFADAQQLRAGARAELCVPRDALLIGAIGNRNPQKGHDALIRAAAALRAELPQIVVRILGAPSPGHGSYERGLHETAERLGLSGSEALRLVDPGARVAELIGALDVLCMPSVPNSEGMPTVILEAMAAGVPVVATDVGAVREAIASADVGVVVAPSDDAALVAGLRELAADPARRRDVAASARDHVHASFSTERLVDAYARAYELAVEHRSTRRRRGALTLSG
jgi:glycosyltransferase involved in cell wall biosynthesis